MMNPFKKSKPPKNWPNFPELSREEKTLKLVDKRRFCAPKNCAVHFLRFMMIKAFSNLL